MRWGFESLSGCYVKIGRIDFFEIEVAFIG